MLHFTTYSCPVAVCKGPASMIPTTGDEGGKIFIFTIEVVSHHSTTTRVFSSDDYTFLFLYSTHTAERSDRSFLVAFQNYKFNCATENSKLLLSVFVTESVVMAGILNTTFVHSTHSAT